MTSSIFNYLGFGNIDPAILFFSLSGFIILLIILIIVIFVQMSRVKKNYEKFMRGKNVRSLESEISGLFEDINFLKESSKKNSDDIKEMDQRLLRAYQKVGIVRYDAFQQMGGKLSFSITLLDDVNNGFILNSVHSTDGCYTYTKEIVGGESYIALGDEERESLNKAMNFTKQKSTGKSGD
ncbi:DUF4446 family protein [bacterium C-53]|nr:DUF4446 family protein [Lachnospiraceae bacterium]NBI03099.1 DUF4446 family protein [Lachnospiraceae bacterium]RKJ10707.1 DUF4446 family protein [bacterium C-53]